MSITKRNNYFPEQDLSNLSFNVDDNRLGNDQTDISVNFGTIPATVTVKVGSVIEVNGNSYVIDTTDVVFQMNSATDHYITFTDNPSTAFSNATTKGTFDAQKQGFYQAGNTTRTLKWYIDQVTSLFYIDYTILNLIDNDSLFNNIGTKNITTGVIDATDVNVSNNIDTFTMDIQTMFVTANVFGSTANMTANFLTTTSGINIGLGVSFSQITQTITAGGLGSNAVAYPAGCTQANTRILSCEVVDNNFSSTYGLGTYLTVTVGYALTAANILVNVVGTSANLTIRIIYMRI